ncbi:MAG: hypothetical protein GY848_05550 [Methyloversatilis sp.]|nr:hypothetical protein [Methyloversatilis sp.]
MEIVLIRLLCVAIAFNAGVRLIDMSSRTAHPIRFAYVAQCSGAMSAVCGLELGLVLMLFGVAIRPLVERRTTR